MRHYIKDKTMLISLRSIKRICLVSIFLCFISIGGFAESGPTDPEEFSEFLDGFIQDKMAEYHIPGSVLVFVKKGKIFYQKGYGYANLELKIPVDPHKTVFRIGSNSKLFVGTAVMQLVEQGKLDLNEDINTYLTTFTVPTIPSKPITLKQLLTHTAGFDELNLNQGTLNKADRVDLGEYLKKVLPDLVMESGQTTSYSNYGVNLAAYIVELVSEMPFHEYVDANILTPLEMHQSGFMPLPKLMKNKAIPYLYRKGKFEILPHEYLHGYTSGSFMTTGTDMAKFLITHLQNGKYNGVEILNKSTTEFMHKQQFTNYPAFPGMAISFKESNHNGTRLLGHGGWVTGFKTMSTLIPEHQAGIFMSTNIEYPTSDWQAFSMMQDVKFRILDQYYPSKTQPSKAVPSFSAIPKSIEGRYRNNRLARKQLTKFGAFMNDSKVEILDNNTILVGKDRYIRKDHLLFEIMGNSRQVAFRTDDNKKITHLFFNDAPTTAWNRLSFFESGFFHQLLVGSSGFVFLMAVLLAPFMIYRQSKKTVDVSNRTPLLWGMVGIIGFLNIGTMVIMIWLLSNSIKISFYWTLPVGFKEILAVPIITVILELVLAGLTIQLWVKKRGSAFSRGFFLVMIVSCLMFTYFMNFWNLLGYHTGSF
jgi:CubicO group peptidase (beta-lactamase class C family)